MIALAPWLPNEPGVAWDFAAAAATGLRVLLVHGRDDEVVAVEQGRSAHRVLERSGVDVTWIEIDAAHELGALLDGGARMARRVSRQGPMGFLGRVSVRMGA